METAFVSIICVALLVIGGMTMSRGFLSSIDNTSANIDSISQRNEQRMRTNITVEEVTQPAANQLEIHMDNIGQVKLAEFAKWDVIVHHRDNANEYYVTWLPYTVSSPGNNEWTVEGIYTDAGLPEVFEPGILNPDEELVLEAKISPPIKSESDNLVIVTTPNGVTVSKTFTGS
ncbi:MAG: hypothetical protein JXA46_12890 [Dehalococcoidales bacterium]|nr:hypothetical protein [Dehalococcoidales bacterium]